MRLFLCALALSTAAFAGTIGGSSERNPVRTHGHAVAATSVRQLIVKLRDTSTAASGRMQAEAVHDRIANLATRTHLRMHESHSITERLHVMVVESDSSADTIATLRSDPDVEYAEPDQRRYIHIAPNDPLFPFVDSSNSGQWFLQNDASTPSAVNAVAAWDITKGSATLVIADLDTGVLFDHPDLLAASAGGRLLPGYDFVSDTNIANDGGGWDADASDPGDEVTTADTNTAQFKNCNPGPSSWHGTRTAGILGALTNNSTGIAGLTWSGKILPVRALGKCGGLDSDILAAMMWAAGMHVDGVPDNANPAKIINMSLGGIGSCPSQYSDVITQIKARGALVVVSAGNEGGAVDAPADCEGVAGVAAIRQEGDKVAFSNLGPQLTVGAPGGNCVNIGPGEPCLFPITSTTNLGVAAPDPNANDYTGAYSCDSTTNPPIPGCTVGANQYRTPNLGTSFSAPIVSGIAALMASANPNLNTCQLIARLKEGSKPFPQSVSTGVSACSVPSGTGSVTPTECLCTNDGKTCGAGMANALGAVTAALRPIAAVTLPATVTAGQSASLSATASAAATGHTITTYQWSSVGSQAASITGATTATASVKAPSCGFETVQITVTDDAGRMDSGNVVLSPSAASSGIPVKATDKACAADPVIMLATCPAIAKVQTGATQTITVSVANTSDDAVTWQVNGVSGGNSTVGTITSAGVYTAPAKVPASGTVTVTATSNADTSVQSTSQVAITAPPSSGGGGGAMDPFTLLIEALLLAFCLAGRGYARRSAASSQVFCARR